MPTPESEAFLAKKPTVPPTFTGVDMLNNQAVYDARDAIIREQWIKQMMARLVREELGKCYVREGVNHLENCGRYRDRYLQLLKENKEKGYRGRQQNYQPREYEAVFEAAINRPENAEKRDRVLQIIKANKESSRIPRELPVIQTDYPTVQEAKGAAGSDRRPGNTIGFGPGGLGRF